MDLRGSRVLGFTGLGFYVLGSRVFLLNLAKLPPGETVRRTLRRVCRCAHELQKNLLGEHLCNILPELPQTFFDGSCEAWASWETVRQKTRTVLQNIWMPTRST